jgi:hypothetical protein
MRASTTAASGSASGRRGPRSCRRAGHDHEGRGFTRHPARSAAIRGGEARRPGRIGGAPRGGGGGDRLRRLAPRPSRRGRAARGGGVRGTRNAGSSSPSRSSGPGPATHAPGPPGRRGPSPEAARARRRGRRPRRRGQRHPDRGGEGGASGSMAQAVAPGSSSWPGGPGGWQRTTSWPRSSWDRSSRSAGIPTTRTHWGALCPNIERVRPHRGLGGSTSL